MLHGSRRLIVVFAVAALAVASLAGLSTGCSGAKTPAGIKAVGNAACPVSGKPVGGSAKAPTFHSDFRGYRVGFMCPVCKGDFDGASDAKKLRLLNKALVSVNKPPVK
jgi:hypothetical protein